MPPAVLQLALCFTSFQFLDDGRIFLIQLVRKQQNQRQHQNDHGTKVIYVPDCSHSRSGLYGKRAIETSRSVNHGDNPSTQTRSNLHANGSSREDDAFAADVSFPLAVFNRVGDHGKYRSGQRCDTKAADNSSCVEHGEIFGEQNNQYLTDDGKTGTHDSEIALVGQLEKNRARKDANNQCGILYGQQRCGIVDVTQLVLAEIGNRSVVAHGVERLEQPQTEGHVPVLVLEYGDKLCHAEVFFSLLCTA